MAKRVFLGETGAAPAVIPIWSTDISVETTGEVTMPRTPAFLAYLGASDANVTGAGATFTLGSVTALTEVFDQNADFNTNGTFTAPVTGRYHFDYVMTVSTLTAAMNNATLSIVTSKRTYTGGRVNIGAGRSSGNSYSINLSVLADMDAADTATFSLVVFNGAGDVATAQGAGSPITYVSGSLEC
jgi:hypothetical protein